MEPMQPTTPAPAQAQAGSPVRQDDASWAPITGAIAVADVPEGAVSLNVAGRRLTGPIQGFGSLWQKTYRVDLGSAADPAEAVRALKEHLPELQPSQNRFFPSVAGVAPGEVVLINARASGMPVATGVLVLYADEESFTLMTPEGHPESGWVTFSACRSGEATIAEIQSLARANDPMYELGFRFMGGSRAQEAIWRHVLASLAARYRLADAPVEFAKVQVDARLQWRYAGNLWRNAMIRTMVYTLATPARWAGSVFRRR